jgi:fatty-acid desaturase
MIGGGRRLLGLLPTVLCTGTFLINSLTHIWGTRRFHTPDESRNNFFLTRS